MDGVLVYRRTFSMFSLSVVLHTETSVQGFLFSFRKRLLVTKRISDSYANTNMRVTRVGTEARCPVLHSAADVRMRRANAYRGGMDQHSGPRRALLQVVHLSGIQKSEGWHWEAIASALIDKRGNDGSDDDEAA